MGCDQNTVARTNELNRSRYACVSWGDATTGGHPFAPRPALALSETVTSIDREDIAHESKPSARWLCRRVAARNCV